ncbi:alpha-N-acetylglucosaminidase-like [Spodoptera frugiperda]|uniref:Alpha-N-acetylglucosaminidase-like n=1 Tax=Spodoptera frugiperda TaxID=7108 RepID=A0A9R0DRR6_SPOFR|nr:alpha-N-acetylglucosaminidase-like [Spodoptera frugiperda]
MRSIIISLWLASAVHSLDLQYLDPTKLQTQVPPEIQQRAALEVIRQYYSKVNVRIDPVFFVNKKDSFHLKTFNGTLDIRASSGVAATWGFNYFLKKYCKSQIAWQTKNVNIPYLLPEVDETVVANDRFRYYQNVCTASYSFVWWNIYDWREHVEWMALNGINLALAPVAQEAAWTQVYTQVGMTQEEIDQHFTGPAFLSWLRMGNVHGWGGPLPKSWNALQKDIQTDIINRMRNLGIVHVLPAFNGHVPVAFSRIFPNSTFHKVKQWNKFDNPYCCGLFLDPFDSLFMRIGKMFLNEISIDTPLSHIYTADPFNEVEPSEFSTALVQQTSKKIFQTLSDFDKDAVWLLQNWMFVNSPLAWPVVRVKSFLNAVPSGRMLILDLQSEQWPQYDLYQMYYGQPFIWCMLHNFGGTLGMFGNMVTINKDVYEVRARANSTMIGIGLTPEGINQNYVVYDLMLESAWRKSPVKDLNAWAADYAERRYGCNETAEAWKYLLKSVYSFNGLSRVRGKYVVTRRPSLKLKPWAWYKSYDLFEAFRKFVSVGNVSCYSDGFRYDLVDVTRQALQYRVEQLYINVVSDRYTNVYIYEASIKRFLDALNDMAQILYQDQHFIASKWFKKARGLGESPDEQDLYELNARNQITLWGPKGEISDYACKQWAELIVNYYLPRWANFLDAALKAKKAGEDFNEKDTRRVVTANIEVPFVTARSNDVDGSSPVGSFTTAMEVAKSLYRRWSCAPDVEDLPVVVIGSDKHRRTTLADDDLEVEETSGLPSVMMIATTPED